MTPPELAACGRAVPESEEQGLSVECPFCYAAPGEPCGIYRLSVRQTAG